MRKTHLYIALTWTALLLASCSDTLFSDWSNHAEGQGIGFDITTMEMGDECISLGENKTAVYPLTGTKDFGLKVHREPLPLMGIHRGAVKGGTVADTRAGASEIVRRDGTNFHDSLTIWGKTDDGTNLFDQILLTKVRNWRNSVEWPYGQGNYMKFYAVAPSMETVNISTSNTVTFSTAPTLNYTLPERISDMRDILYGESDNISIAGGPPGSITTNPKQENLGKDNKFVQLNFRHITTAIRFSQGTIPTGLTITEISLIGINTYGSFTPGANDVATGTTGTWNGQDVTRNYTITTNHDGTGTSIENVYIDNGQILFMIPQTLPAGAKLQITLTDTKGTVDTADDQEHTLTCDINGDVWKKGYTENYKITIGQLVEGYYLAADPVAEIEHSNTAVSGTINIDSYRLYSDYSSGVKQPIYRPITWTVEGYSTDGTNFSNTRPTWLTDFHGVLSEDVYVGGKDAAASFTLARQEMALSTSHDVVLSENNAAGTASSWDLATKNPDGTTKSSETANCYIVNRSGSYTFPLVYGNMSADNATQQACFKDHAGNTITKYKIREQIGAKLPNEVTHGTTEYLWMRDKYADKNIEGTLRVQLLWEDVEGLVTSPTVNESADGNTGNIGFTISQSVPGNAVIALQARKVTYATDYASLSSSSVNTYGDWETLWTWHIWMTDEVYQNDGKEDEQFYDTYYINGAATNTKASHIAQLYQADGTTPVAKILPVNLGWVPDNLEFGLYKKREAWVKLKQSVSGLETIVKITQHARQNLYTGTGTVYQWGRPTAFPAFRTVSGTLRPIYDLAGNNITNHFVMAQATAAQDAITKPFGILQWETNQNSWFDINSDDYVTANAMWNATTKTVYDPCPPGFRVPPVNIFTGFSKTDAKVTSGSGQLNMYPDVENLNEETMKSGELSKGGYFYTKKYTDANSPARYDQTVYMPSTAEFHGNKAVGTQMSDVSTQLNNINGIYWTSDYSKDATSKACYLWITPEYTYSEGTAEKPVIGFFGTSDKQNYYSSVRGIRPMKTE